MKTIQDERKNLYEVESSVDPKGVAAKLLQWKPDI